MLGVGKGTLKRLPPLPIKTCNVNYNDTYLNNFNISLIISKEQTNKPTTKTIVRGFPEAERNVERYNVFWRMKY